MESIEERNRKILEVILEQSKIDLASPEAALAALVRIGIFTPDGKIRPEFDPNSARFYEELTDNMGRGR
ncbi:MAG: hypothetical protein SF002_16170 [Alphaproteobacteria bacterium]|nr:hypothetical protein [Alphaproteobacteria bacterium]